MKEGQSGFSVTHLDLHVHVETACRLLKSIKMVGPGLCCHPSTIGSGGNSDPLCSDFCFPHFRIQLTML
jgi:hypothetical protein